MKDWYKSLEKKYRYILHGIAIAISLICIVVIVAIKNETILAIMSLLLIVAVIFEVLFVKWERLLSKTETAKQSTNEFRVSNNTPKFDAKNPLTEVKIIDIDGSVIYKPCYYKITNDDLCLVSEGGKTYHTHCNCYKHWKSEYINNFQGWKVIPIKEATSNGLTKCKFCQFNDMSMEEKVNYKANGRKFCIVELDGYSNEEVQSNIQCAIPFEQVDMEYDLEKGKYIITDHGNKLGYIKAQDITKIASIIDEIELSEAYIYEINSSDDLKEKIKILVVGDYNHKA